MIKILQKIKTKIDFWKNKWIFFKSLALGEVIWAKMPLSKMKMKQIEVEHRVRPYVIVRKSKFFIYAFQSSSKKWKKAYNTQEYRINRLRYHIPKDSYITLRKIYKIPFWDIKSKYFKLLPIDLQNIEKRLEILQCCEKFDMNYSLKEGDVIQVENKLYYIYASDNSNLYCLIIYSNKPSNQYENIKINHKFFYTKFEKKAVFSRKSKMSIINLAFPEEVEIIENQIKNYKRKKKKTSC